MKLLDYSPQPTTGLQIHTSLQIFFWKCSERSRCSKIPKIPIKPLKNFPFSLTLQACSPEFQTLTKADFKRNVSCENSEINGNLAGKIREKNHFMNVNMSLHIFLGCSEKLLFWKFPKIPRKMS